jgi:hypothetical protein
MGATSQELAPRLAKGQLWKTDDAYLQIASRRAAAPERPTSQRHAGEVAKRLKCVQLAGALGRLGMHQSGSKLVALQTLRGVARRPAACESGELGEIRGTDEMNYAALP